MSSSSDSLNLEVSGRGGQRLSQSNSRRPSWLHILAAWRPVIRVFYSANPFKDSILCKIHWGRCLWGSTEALDLEPELLLQLNPFIFSVVKVCFHRHFHGRLSKSHGVIQRSESPRECFLKSPPCLCLVYFSKLTVYLNKMASSHRRVHRWEGKALWLITEDRQPPLGWRKEARAEWLVCRHVRYVRLTGQHCT